MFEFFKASPLIAWSVVAFLLAIVVIVSLWDQVKWWALNTWYKFPVLGKTTRLSKNFNKASGMEGWYQSEQVLCKDFNRFIPAFDEGEFQKNSAFLEKIREHDRSTTPFFIWFLTVGLVIVEALGFSYVLAGWTVPGASENTQQIAAVGIAFLISVVLVALTHFAGHEIYVNGLVKAAQREWLQGGRNGHFSTGIVSLNQDQQIDHEKPSYTQLVNRLGKTEPSHIILIATIIFVIVVAVGATYVRGQVLTEQETANVANCGAQTDSAFGSGKSGDGLDIGSNNPGNLGLPEGVTKAQSDADKMACDDKKTVRMSGGWATFIVLAVVFVFLQFLGVIFGMKWGFATRQSKLAFKKNGNGKYTSFRDMQNSVREIFDAAQGQLQNLQELLIMNSSRKGIAVHCEKNFQDYLKQQREDVGYNPEKPATQPRTAPAPVVPVLVPTNAEVSNLDDELARMQVAVNEKRKREEIARLQKELGQ